MGRGRAKAKQTRVARELKYSSPNTDLSALQKELTGAPSSYTAPARATDDDDDDDEYSDRWADGDADDEGVSPAIAADRLAEERIAAVGRLATIRLPRRG